MRTMFRKSMYATALAAMLIAPIAINRPLLASGGQAQVSDDTLKDRIEYRLQTAAGVKKYDLSVKVEAGVALLTGTVATTAQKTEAGTLAAIKGVSKVDNQIAIDKAVDQTLTEHAKNGLRRTGGAITDTWITTKVKWFFLGDDLLKGSSVDVNTDNRVVTLGGTVTTTAARTRAVALANNTDGVMKVVNNIRIGPSGK